MGEPTNPFNTDKPQESRQQDSAIDKARRSLKRSLPKRFYQQAHSEQTDDGLQILLDGKKVHTPARNTLIVPHNELARLLVEEFNIQEEFIDPDKMPISRLTNTVIDGIVGDPQPIVEDMLRYAQTDMLLYRAESPKELVARQNDLWDPLLDWIQAQSGAQFIPHQGIMPQMQAPEAIQALSNYLRRFEDPYQIAALHTMTTLSGSIILALAIASGEIDVAEGWDLAHLEEDWTIELWGEDLEAKQLRAAKQNEIYAAAALFAATQAN